MTGCLSDKSLAKFSVTSKCQPNLKSVCLEYQLKLQCTSIVHVCYYQKTGGQLRSSGDEVALAQLFCRSRWKSQKMLHFLRQLNKSLRRKVFYTNQRQALILMKSFSLKKIAIRMTCTWTEIHFCWLTFYLVKYCQKVFQREGTKYCSIYEFSLNVK